MRDATSLRITHRNSWSTLSAQELIGKLRCSKVTTYTLPILFVVLAPTRTIERCSSGRCFAFRAPYRWRNKGNQIIKMKDQNIVSFHYLSVLLIVHGPVAWLFVVRVPAPFVQQVKNPCDILRSPASCFLVARSLLTRIWRRTPKDLTLLSRLHLMLARNEHLQWTLSGKRSYSQITEMFGFFVKHISFELYWLWLQSTKTIGARQPLASAGEKVHKTSREISYCDILSCSFWRPHVSHHQKLGDNKFHKKQIPPKTTLH